MAEQLTYTNSKGSKYYLFMRLAKNGITKMHFFASSNAPRENGDPVYELDSMYAVKEAPRTGLLIVYRPDKDGKRITRAAATVLRKEKVREAIKEHAKSGKPLPKFVTNRRNKSKASKEETIPEE